MSRDLIMMCAVCGRVLDHDSDLGWSHSLQDRIAEDHPAVPVPQGEVPIIGRCDFCNTDYPTMVVPARSFVVIGRNMSDGDWAACTVCGKLIARNAWIALIERVIRLSSNGALIPRAVLRQSLVTLYAKLRNNITGPPQPLDPTSFRQK